MRQLLIRLDDIAPAMDWERFERLETLFAQYHIRPIIGVVPDCRDPKLSVQSAREDFWERIRALQEKGWTVAQHGWQHDYVTAESGMLGINPFSEFAGLSCREQYLKLKKGQEILHKNGICATMFMAPGHTYDKNTLKALKRLHFRYVTDGYCTRPYRRKGLVFLPCTLSKPRVPKAFDTLCLHANHMSEDDFAQLREFVEHHQDLIGDAGQIKAVFYHPGMWLQEKKNLFIRKMKRFAAENETVQEYFCRTDSSKPFVRKGRRIMGLPGLLIRLILPKKNT